MCRFKKQMLETLEMAVDYMRTNNRLFKRLIDHPDSPEAQKQNEANHERTI